MCSVSNQSHPNSVKTNQARKPEQSCYFFYLIKIFQITIDHDVRL